MITIRGYRLTPEQVERFWAKVKKGPGNACWKWQGYIARWCGGYGVADLQMSPRIALRAHVLAYELVKGRVPHGMMLRHKCDNPPCCNPHHLIPGTAKQNSEDMIRRKRHWVWTRPERISRGRNHWTKRMPEVVPAGSAKGRCAKLDEKKVREIRRRYATGKVSQRKLAEDYRVSQPAIWQIVSGNQWKHVA